MRYIVNSIIIFMISSYCNAAFQGRGNGSADEDHNCIVLIREGGVVFDDLHGHVDEGQVENWHHYSVLIPQGVSDLHIHSIGGYGDADLYTREDEVPTLDIWDCRPYHNGNDESCTSRELFSGKDYYFSLNAATSDYDGSDLKVNYNLPDDENMDRIEGFGWPANSYSKGNIKYFMIHVPQGLKNLEITTDGGTGDADLYVRKGITENIFAEHNVLKSTGAGNDESVFQRAPAGGTYTIGLHAKDSFSDVHVKVRYNAFNPGDASAVNDIPVPSSKPQLLSLNNKNIASFYHGATRYFYIDASGELPWLLVTGFNWDGDMDLYVAKDKLPTTSDYDCRSINSGMMVNGIDDGFGYDNKKYEECRVPVNSAGRYYIMVSSYKERYYSRGTVKAVFYSSGIKHIDGGQPVAADRKVPWFIPDSCGKQMRRSPYPGYNRDYTLLNSYAAEETLCIPASAKTNVTRSFLVRVPSAFHLTIKTDHGTGNGDLYVAESDSMYLTTRLSRETRPTELRYTRKSIATNNRECIEITSTSFNSLFVNISYVGQHNGATLHVTRDDPNGCGDVLMQ